jgi:Leucine carboxyl methyltransferase
MELRRRNCHHAGIVSYSSRKVAAYRALESEQAEPLFVDPLAELMAGPRALKQARRVISRHSAAAPAPSAGPGPDAPASGPLGDARGAAPAPPVPPALQVPGGARGPQNPAQPRGAHGKAESPDVASGDPANGLGPHGSESHGVADGLTGTAGPDAGKGGAADGGLPELGEPWGGAPGGRERPQPGGDGGGPPGPPAPPRDDLLASWEAADRGTALRNGYDGARFVTRIAIRTKWFDDRLVEALCGTAPGATRVQLRVDAAPAGGAGVALSLREAKLPLPQQVVLLGAGMDSRAWRLPLPQGAPALPPPQSRIPSACQAQRVRGQQKAVRGVWSGRKESSNVERVSCLEGFLP